MIDEILPEQLSGLTVFPIDGGEAGKGGKGGEIQITNAEFIASVFPDLLENAFAAVCSKSGDPRVGGWPCQRADKAADTLAAEKNNYVGCSSFYPGDDGTFKALKAQFTACHFLMLDDLGTKAPLDRLDGFDLSWLIETSPGNYQGGIIFAEPITDGPAAYKAMSHTPAAWAPGCTLTAVPNLRLRLSANRGRTTRPWQTDSDFTVRPITPELRWWARGGRR